MNSKRFATALALGLVALLLGTRAGAQNGTGLPWTANFESGDFREWNRGYRSDSGLTVVSGGAQQGTYSARAPLTQGTQNENTYAEHVFGDWFNLPTPKTKVEELYLRLYSKFSSGYQWPSNGNKVAIINLTNGVDSARHYQVYISINPDGTYRVDNSYIDSWQFNGMSQNVGSPVRVRFDQWDKLKLYVRLNTPGASNGIVRLWINDALKLDYPSRNLRQSTTQGMNKLLLSGWAQDQSPVNGQQWWDSWSLSQTDPDGGTSPPPPPEVPPAPPTNVRVIR